MTSIHEGLMLNSLPKQVQQSTQGILGKDDFLKILITQLQNQDPANPMDDREFIAQMAQFSSLEQMTNMNQAMQKFITMQTSQNLVQHSELIGKNVQWKREVPIDEYRSRTEHVENIVTSVKLETDGQLRIQLDDGRWISNEQIIQVSKAEDKKQQTED
ncbi:flagellar hook assembly protein FlgD [Halalkalibacter alkaliphilus]|uniref:Flagellar hook assembly protein FlgD n=1 Tax=Halalkalibacter alkaliphilus TaxID=2917993 RepID=A0A9X2CQY9_9BACI|nr:flagellar hook assembly protein FlgD [Halalkalibacter alkaliphilus]MCL7746471.1 flagellar hook assembly protein FlgD [Halalkalibacter alkaliphilus]